MVLPYQRVFLLDQIWNCEWSSGWAEFWWSNHRRTTFHQTCNRRLKNEERIEVINYLGLVQMGVLVCNDLYWADRLVGAFCEYHDNTLYHQTFLSCLLSMLLACWQISEKNVFFVIFLFKAKTVTRREFSLKMNHNKLKIAQFIPKR